MKSFVSAAENEVQQPSRFGHVFLLKNLVPRLWAFYSEKHALFSAVLGSRTESYRKQDFGIRKSNAALFSSSAEAAGGSRIPASLMQNRKLPSGQFEF